MSRLMERGFGGSAGGGAFSGKVQGCVFGWDRVMWTVRGPRASKL